MTAQTGRPSHPLLPSPQKAFRSFRGLFCRHIHIPSHSNRFFSHPFLPFGPLLLLPLSAPTCPRTTLQATPAKYVLPVLPAHLPPVSTRSLCCGWTCSQVQCETEMTLSCCASLRCSSAHWHTFAHLQPTNRSGGLAQHCASMRYYFRSNRKRATRQKHAPTSECVPHHPTLTLPQEL